MTELTFELAPKPGMTASQRKAELDSARFVAVRAMAHMHYKDANGNPLMTYQQTLDDRERVKQVILIHEIASGLVTDDLGVAQGAQQMAPVTQPVAQPTPAAHAQVPQMMTPAYSVPQPSAPATPAQAVQAAQIPAPQAAPEASAPRTRTRRGAGGGVPAGVPAPQQQMMPAVSPMPSPMPGPGMPMPAPMGMPQPMVAPQFSQPMMAPPMGMSQQAPAAVADLGAVLAKLDDLGRGLTIISKAVEGLTKQVEGLGEDVADEMNLVLCALHHIYGAQGSLYQLLAQEKVASAADFRKFISKYAGPQ
jgi:hypothetical protein